MVAREHAQTVEDFERFIERPENAGRLFEYIGGEIVEVPSNIYASAIAQLVSFFLQLFIREHNIAGYVTGEAGGYMVAGERYAPDVAFIHASKQGELTRKGYSPNPPDLAVEIISDVSNSVEQEKLRIKITNYLSVGVLVWVVNPERRLVEVHQVGQPVRLVSEAGRLDGGEVLPGFTLPVKEIFPKE